MTDEPTTSGAWWAVAALAVILILITGLALLGDNGTDQPPQMPAERPGDEPEKHVWVAGQNITVELDDDVEFDSHPQHPNLTDRYDYGDAKEIRNALLVNREGYTVCMEEQDDDFDDPTEYRMQKADIDHIHVTSFDKFVKQWNIEDPYQGDYKYRNRYRHPEKADDTPDDYWYLYVFEYIRQDGDSLWVYADCWGEIFKISTHMDGGELVP